MHPFKISPAQTNAPVLPVVASIPHTGTYVPAEIDALFINDAVRQLRMTDWYLYELYDFLSELGVTVISANYSRYVIDLNRSPVPLELYPGRFETKLVSDSDFQGEAIFSEYPSAELIETYKNAVHAPYHKALQYLLEHRLESHAKVYLFDLHSIARYATRIHAELDKDIYLGDRDGGSCSKNWSQQVSDLYRSHDFSVQHNSPYKGGYITHHYGLDKRVEAIQIEMNQDVYMDSDNIESSLGSDQFNQAKTRLRSLFTELLQILDY